MKAIKFRELEIGQTFYKVGDYNKIEQYEKISDSCGLEVLTNSSKWFDDYSNVYAD